MTTQTDLKPCGTHAAKMRHNRNNETCDTCFPERPNPCGTYAGYSRHKRRGEESCPECRTAKRRYESERIGRDPEPRKLAPCGTIAALRRHRNHRETPCPECLAAERAYAAERRRNRGINPAPETTALIEEIEFLLACGEGELRILQAVGLNRGNLQQRLYRQNRHDLYKTIFEPTPGWVGN